MNAALRHAEAAHVERMFMCSGERMLLVLQRSALVGPQGLQAAAFHNLGYARSSPARLSQPGRTTVPSAPTSRLMLHGLRAHPLCRDSDNLVSRPSAARPSRRRYSLPLPLFATSPPQHHHRPRLRSVAYPPPHAFPFRRHRHRRIAVLPPARRQHPGLNGGGGGRLCNAATASPSLAAAAAAAAATRSPGPC